MVSLNVNKNIYRSNWKPSPIIGQLKKNNNKHRGWSTEYMFRQNICMNFIDYWFFFDS